MKKITETSLSRRTVVGVAGGLALGVTAGGVITKALAQKVLGDAATPGEVSARCGSLLDHQVR